LSALSLFSPRRLRTWLTLAGETPVALGDLPADRALAAQDFDLLSAYLRG